MKIDLHAHTNRSRDATLTPADLVERAREAGLDRIAVTDHNHMEGAWAARSIDPALVIPGEEIDCADGSDLIGLFLSEPIPPGLSVWETAERIRAQGGLVYAPHPFAYLRHTAARAEAVLAVADIVEVFNARAFFPAWNRRAHLAARVAGLRMAAGSDSHFPFEIGGAWTELPDFQDGAGLLASLEHARVGWARQPSPLVHVASFGIMVGRRAARMLPWGRDGSGGVPVQEPVGEAG